MTLDVLEQRLADLAVDSPDPGRVTAMVMSRAAGPRRRHVARAFAIGVATVALMAVVLYFVPAADVVLADTPIARELLRDAGLLGAGNRVTSVGAVSTSSGYRLELVGAYADSARTVLLVHTEPAVWLWGSGSGTDLEITDQFGRHYRLKSGTGNGLTGDSILDFEPLAWPDAIIGARITLHLTSVVPFTCTGSPAVDPAGLKCTQGSPVAGSWTLPATLGVDDGTDLALPAPAKLGPAGFRFTSVRATPATITVDFEITGVTWDELNRRIPDGRKGTPVFTIHLLDATGDIVTSSYQTSGKDEGVRARLLGKRLKPGEYHVHVTYVGYGEFDRVIRVP
ncbi:MAG: hypothetical protein PVS3B2_01640 [Candidatus Dormibacteraceae bacterium]